MKSRSGEEKAGYTAGSHSESLSSSGRLTSEQLSKLPKRNNDPYILAYIQEQRAYIKHYISAGLTESNSWHEHYSESQCIPDFCSRVTEEHLDDFNFGTPVLKARISKSGNRDAALDPRKGDKMRNPLGGSLTRVTQQRAEERLDSDNGEETPPRIRGTDSMNFYKGGTKGRTLKVGVQHSSSTLQRISEISNHEETEKAKRLSERRQRKRVKRDIMKPPPSPEKENREDHPTKVNRKTGKGSATQTRAQAGFALMHGFFATNVGKNRLTLSPLLQNVGVFKKGKASRVAKIAEMVSKKQDISSAHFSELKFLGKRTRKTSQTSSIQSSPSTSTHSAVPSKKLHSSHDRPLVERTAQQDKGQDSERSEVKSVQRETSRKSYNPEESIIWDIEQGSHNADTDCGALDQREELNFCVDAPDSKAQAKECPLTGDDLATSIKSSGWVPLNQNRIANIDSGDHVSVVSLGPSQSASQIRVLETESRRRNLEYASKYFKHMAAAPTHLFEPLEVHIPASLGETLVPPLHAADLQASHPASICHLPEEAPQNCLMIIEPSCNSMDIDGVDHLPACSTPAGKGQSCLSRFDFSLSSYAGLPDTWNIDDLGELNNDLYQGSDVITDPCYVFGTVVAETYDVNKQFGAEEFALETPSDGLGTYRTQLLQYEAMQDEFGEEQGVDSQAGGISLDHFDNEEESNIRSEGLYIWTDQSSASRVDHLSEEGPDIYENCFGSSDLDPESDLVMVNFHQGRALLFGVNQTYQEGLQPKSSNRLLNVEAEVAGSLKQNHWLPQRP